MDRKELNIFIQKETMHILKTVDSSSDRAVLYVRLIERIQEELNRLEADK